VNEISARPVALVETFRCTINSADVRIGDDDRSATFGRPLLRNVGDSHNGEVRPFVIGVTPAIIALFHGFAFFFGLTSRGLRIVGTTSAHEA
jgi:hypothetical protein